MNRKIKKSLQRAIENLEFIKKHFDEHEYKYLTMLPPGKLLQLEDPFLVTEFSDNETKILHDEILRLRGEIIMLKGEINILKLNNN